MKKMVKHHRGRPSLQERTLKNSGAWRRLTKKESGAGQRRAGSPGGEGEIDSRPALHHLAEDDEGEQASGGLNHFVSRSAAGTQRTWKKVTVVVDVRSSRECDAEEHDPRDR